MYTEPYQEECCANCKYRRYDSFFNEPWCGHEPKPEDLHESRLISNFGNCEYFKKENFNEE